MNLMNLMHFGYWCAVKESDRSVSPKPLEDLPAREEQAPNLRFLSRDDKWFVDLQRVRLFRPVRLHCNAAMAKFLC
jgi:hypothetical protein